MESTLARLASRNRPSASGAAVRERSPASRQAPPGQVKLAQRRGAPPAPAGKPALRPQPTPVPLSAALPPTPASSRASPGFVLEKMFTVLGLTVGSLMVLLFGLDLVTALPFQRASLVADVGFLVSGALLVYLSIDVLRDQRRRGLW